MIDVHPPHGSVHGWRDFFIHIATITIGLLIALSLEAMVEAIHHRHIVREARENIRREIEQNEKQAKDNIGFVESDAERMKENMEKARDLRTDPQALSHQTMHFSFEWSSFNDSAWLSGRDSGALAYMPTSEVQSYADAYKQQAFINEQAIAVFSYQTNLAAPIIMEKDSTAFRPENREELDQRVRGRHDSAAWNEGADRTAGEGLRGCYAPVRGLILNFAGAGKIDL